MSCILDTIDYGAAAGVLGNTSKSIWQQDESP